MKRAAPHPLLIDRKTAARLLGVSVDTVRRHPELFEPVAVGSRRLYRLTQIRAFGGADAAAGTRPRGEAALR